MNLTILTGTVTDTEGDLEAALRRQRVGGSRSPHSPDHSSTVDTLQRVADDQAVIMVEFLFDRVETSLRLGGASHRSCSSGPGAHRTIKLG